jgi:hypothetical protein
MISGSLDKIYVLLVTDGSAFFGDFNCFSSGWILLSVFVVIVSGLIFLMA